MTAANAKNAKNAKPVSVRERLAAGPTRGLGCATAVAAEALRQPAELRELVHALKDHRPLVLVRAAGALKKVQAAQPELLAPFARRILRAALACEVLQARWNLTIVVGKLPLWGADRALATDLMFEALASQSAFLRTFALQGLADFAHNDAALERRVRPILEDALATGTAAMRARARKLLPLLHP